MQYKNIGLSTSKQSTFGDEF